MPIETVILHVWMGWAMSTQWYLHTLINHKVAYIDFHVNLSVAESKGFNACTLIQLHPLDAFFNGTQYVRVIHSGERSVSLHGIPCHWVSMYRHRNFWPRSLKFGTAWSEGRTSRTNLPRLHSEGSWVHYNACNKRQIKYGTNSLMYSTSVYKCNKRSQTVSLHHAILFCFNCV